MNARERTNKHDEGSAVVDFVLVMLILVPLVFGIAQLGLVLHVRNVTTAAASEGARSAAVHGATLESGIDRARTQISQGIADRFAQNVTASVTSVAGAPGVEVVVRSRVPALGLFGPTIALTARGHAVQEVTP